MKGIKKKRLTTGDSITTWAKIIDKRDFHVEKIYFRKVILGSDGYQ